MPGTANAEGHNREGAETSGKAHGCLISKKHRLFCVSNAKEKINGR